MHVDMGLVGEVFTKSVIASLCKVGNMAVGHVCYGAMAAILARMLSRWCSNT